MAAPLRHLEHHGPRRRPPLGPPATSASRITTTPTEPGAPSALPPATHAPMCAPPAGGRAAPATVPLLHLGPDQLQPRPPPRYGTHANRPRTWHVICPTSAPATSWHQPCRPTTSDPLLSLRGGDDHTLAVHFFHPHRLPGAAMPSARFPPLRPSPTQPSHQCAPSHLAKAASARYSCFRTHKQLPLAEAASARYSC